MEGIDLERSLHRQLKERYGPEVGGQLEVAIGEFRVDAVAADGRLIEIQLAPLRQLKRKLARLLPSNAVEVVKPVIVARRVIQRIEPGGIDLSARRSPKRGAFIEVFEELVGLVHLFPHANLTISLLAVEVDEIRIKRRRRPGYSVVDRVLKEVVETFALKEADDLWSLLPEGLPDQFSSQDLAERIGRSLQFAQRATYCLRRSGAAKVVAKLGNRLIYERRAVVETY
jgi:hypothetical protein